MLLQWIEILGGDLSKIDKKGRTVLNFAVNGRQLSMVKWLTFQRNLILSSNLDYESIKYLLGEALKEMAPVGAISHIRQQVECSICLDQSINCALTPCGHACCCLDCASTIEICPLCRIVIENPLRIY